MRKLTIADIADLRAYEREREEFRARIIALKKRRRIALGALVTVVFENTDTMRFQIQEMARAEKIIDDDRIQHELDTYNQIIPDQNELSVTLLIELTTEDLLREWLGKLVGIQRCIAIVLHDGSRVAGRSLDEDRLTREEVTAAVHFLKFEFSPAQVAAFAAGAARIVVDHEHYRSTVELGADEHAELLGDLEAS